MSTSRYDYAVVGGGIAGLAIAEIFARSGRSVVLIERNAQLCQETSASQHGWFHFGSLYSIFPQNQVLRTMIGGVENLREYYAGFAGMNIKVTDGGWLCFPQAEAAWFRDEPIEYIVCARNDRDFDMGHFDGVREYAKKLVSVFTWELAIKQFISRHQRFHKHNWGGTIPASRWIPRAGFSDYSREVISKPTHTDINLDRDTHFRIVGYDRPMRVTAIVTDLVCSFIGSCGRIVAGQEVVQLEKSGSRIRLHTVRGLTIEARTIIAAAGQLLGRFVDRSNGVKVVSAPLMVAYPAVSSRNFVRMTPFVEKSVNHLHHQVGGLTYSLIGGGVFSDPDDTAAVARARDGLVAMASAVFPKLSEAQFVETYLGYKTEFVGQGSKRNYQYVVRNVSDGIYAVTPGKFSLAFSLAVNTFRRITGEAPRRKISLSTPEAAAPYVGVTRHARMVREAVKEEIGQKTQCRLRA